ncbi:MAG: pantetheine-phosphate adenylyltransferase [Clostridia bacterium]|nr:pantetheine-phosphate adenylyltransferase [Clostridia bacterium]
MRKQKRIAVIPGSFDPITLGHLDIIRRASEIFDHVYVAVSENAEKKTMFDARQRLEMAKIAVDGLPNVTAEICKGLLADYLHEKKSRYLVKGIRGSADADYEGQLASIMRSFDPSFESVWLPASEGLSHISSTYARELIRYRRDPAGALPEGVIEYLEKNGI